MSEALQRLRKLVEAATPGPWRSLRDGNQYIGTSYIPAAKSVGASRVEGLPRPWNPHRFAQFGFKADKHETSRFLDADADFIQAARVRRCPSRAGEGVWDVRALLRLGEGSVMHSVTLERTDVHFPDKLDGTQLIGCRFIGCRFIHNSREVTFLELASPQSLDHRDHSSSNPQRPDEHSEPETDGHPGRPGKP